MLRKMHCGRSGRLRCITVQGVQRMKALVPMIIEQGGGVTLDFDPSRIDNVKKETKAELIRWKSA